MRYALLENAFSNIDIIKGIEVLLEKNITMSKITKKFENINPATGDILCSVAKCNHKDVDLAVKVSRKAFESGVWSKTAPEFRKEIYLNLQNY